MKKGFYKSSRINVKDNYGGVVYNIESYYYIGYIDDNRLFFILAKGDGFPNWELFNEQFENIDIKGKIIIENGSQLEICFYNPYLKTKEFFIGRYEGNDIYLKSYRENKPDMIWFEDLFKYIGIEKDQL